MLRALPGRLFAFAAPVVFAMIACQARAEAPATRPVIPDRTEKLPQEIEGLAVVENVNGKLPLDLRFVDEFSKPVTLGTYFASGRPVILNLGYYRCPMLFSSPVRKCHPAAASPRP
jgi:cytochrome oxidase Cu insertion factor (SCO1/SenC/PrrC family)